MKALILAAGIGSRLAPITEKVPKSMVPVNGKPILEKQIDNLHENGIEEIVIVTGYKSEVIEDMVNEKHKNITIIKSENYLNTNNMYSAYLAKDKLKDDDFLMMNADVFYDSSVLTELLNTNYKNAIVTDIENYNEESMKVVSKNGKLLKISKQISKDEALGSSIDVYKFSMEAGIKFFDKCHEYIVDKKELKLWSEVALNDILSIIDFEACPLVGRWFEIDNFDDLKAAEKLFSSKELKKC